METPTEPLQNTSINPNIPPICFCVRVRLTTTRAGALCDMLPSSNHHHHPPTSGCCCCYCCYHHHLLLLPCFRLDLVDVLCVLSHSFEHAHTHIHDRVHVRFRIFIVSQLSMLKRILHTENVHRSLYVIIRRKCRCNYFHWNTSIRHRLYHPNPLSASTSSYTIRPKLIRFSIYMFWCKTICPRQNEWKLSRSRPSIRRFTI